MRSLRVFERFKHHVALAALVLIALFGVETLFLALKWPFTRSKVLGSLEHFSGSRVQISTFHQIYFPDTGYIAQNVVFTRDSGGAAVQMATVEMLSCHASWFAMLTFTHRVKEMQFRGLHVTIPTHVPPALRLHEELTITPTITAVSADGTTLDIAPRRDGGPGLRFLFHKLVLKNVAKNKAIDIRTVLDSPKPPANLSVNGTVGPFQTGKLGQTPLSGNFQMSHADLHTYKPIAGVMQSSGSFHGTLGRLEMRGNVLIPDFEIVSSHHAVGLSAEFQSIVNGLTGNVSIEHAATHFLDTTLLARGSIDSQPGQSGKTVSLALTSEQARVQDLLRLFVTANRPPLYGAIVLHAHVVLPPGHETFIRRVRLTGDFDITEAQFSRASTQQDVNKLSERASKIRKPAESADSTPVFSNLKANANLRGGTAFLSNASFRVPDAVARGEGSYNIVTETIDLHGTLAMQASLSQAAGGMKSILLLPLDPLYRKKYAGAVLPFRVTGTYAHPQFHISLTGKR